MWPLVREGLRIYRPVLLGAWALCIGGIAVVMTVLVLVGVGDARRALLWAASAWPLYMLLASAVPGWIALGNEMGEKRLRLHLLLPLPLREVARARLLLPVALLILGLPLSHLIVAGVRLATPKTWTNHALVDLLAAHILFVHMGCFLVKEIAVLKERGWRKVVLACLGLTLLANLDAATNLLPEVLYLRTAAVLVLAAVTGWVANRMFLRRRELAL